MIVHSKYISLTLSLFRNRTITDFTFVYPSMSLWYSNDYLYSCYYRSIKKMDRVEWFWKVKQDLKNRIKSWK